MKIPEWIRWTWLIICGLWMGFNLIYIQSPIHSITAFLNLVSAGVLLLDSLLNVPISNGSETE